MRSPRSKLEKPRLVIDRCAKRALLHVAVARAWHAASRKRDLDKAGTVEPEHGLAAPQIRRADKALRDGDKIALILIDGRKMRRRHVATAMT